MTTIDKRSIIENYKINSVDTGSCRVQVALLTERIRLLTEHLRTHRKDFHSRRGLIAMANRRRKLLSYIKSHNVAEYGDLIRSLGLRK